MMEPPPLPYHDGNDMLHGEVCAPEIDGKDAVPFRLRGLHHAAHLGDPDIVVEHVDPAVGRKAGLDHRLDVAPTRDVGGEGCRATAVAGDDLGGLFGSSRVAVDAKYLRAFAREGDRGRLAVAPTGADRAGTDHHRRLALEPIHLSLSRLYWQKPRKISTEWAEKTIAPDAVPACANGSPIATT